LGFVFLSGEEPVALFRSREFSFFGKVGSLVKRKSFSVRTDLSGRFRRKARIAAPMRLIQLLLSAKP